MDRYLSYSNYQSKGGTIPENSYNVLEYKAEKIIDRYTFNRLRNLEEVPEEVEYCIMNLLSVLEDDANANISSESIGNYSYTRLTQNERKNVEYDIIKTYLSGILVNNVPVLYIGADL